jgi:hypothetical protein
MTLPSYIGNADQRTTLYLPAARPRFDEARGGWFAFTPRYVDAPFDCQAGAWWGPCPTEAMAEQVADELNDQMIALMERLRSRALQTAGKNSTLTEPVQITDLYKRREDLKRDLAAVEVAIERCHHDWPTRRLPPSKTVPAPGRGSRTGPVRSAASSTSASTPRRGGPSESGQGRRSSR